MNQLLKYLTASALLVLASHTATAQKIGYINFGALLTEIPAVKQANSNLEAFQTQLQKKYEGMFNELRTKYVELQRKEQQGELSPKQIEEEATKLRAEEQKLQETEQSIQNQLLEKRNELLQPILDDVTGKIQTVAKENGFTYIIDDSAGILLYKEEANDITPLVKTKLGL